MLPRLALNCWLKEPSCLSLLRSWDHKAGSEHIMCDLLVRMVSAKFLHWEVTMFLLVTDKYLFGGWCCLVVYNLSSMQEALGSVPSCTRKNKKQYLLWRLLENYQVNIEASEFHLLLLVFIDNSSLRRWIITTTAAKCSSSPAFFCFSWNCVLSFLPQ